MSTNTSMDLWDIYNKDAETEVYTSSSDSVSDSYLSDSDASDCSSTDIKDIGEAGCSGIKDIGEAGCSAVIAGYEVTTPANVEPAVPLEYIPKLGKIYNSSLEAQKVYHRYAKLAGFVDCLGSQTYYGDKSVKRKFLRCNRCGSRPVKKDETLEESDTRKKGRKSWSKVTDCKAMMCILRDNATETFRICGFHPLHNHDLCKSSNDAERKNRKRLTILDKHHILKLSTLNMGPVKAHKIRSCLKGGFDKIIASPRKFLNFWRDFIRIIGPNDAQFVVDQLSIRKRNYPNFFFKYKMNGNILNALFWADELAQENYSHFYDVISVDATYRSNRHRMIFVPFTAINNHDRSINIGAALVSDETIESYAWVLDTFLEVHGKPPNFILSDQDPALNHAIKKVLPNTTHRLCMWHIMTKMTMPGKIARDIADNNEFKTHMHKLVWDIHLKKEEFEKRWDQMLTKFNLRDNKWLHDMFNIRDRWIPGYFSHIPMCCLMKTTSRSESSNSFFNVFSSHNNLVVNFMFNFDTAVTKQSYDQQRHDSASNKTSTKLVTLKFNQSIELHAFKVYTEAIFRKIQKALTKAISLCHQRTEDEFEDHKIHTIVYKNHINGDESIFQVTRSVTDDSTECSCRSFDNFGILCCHIFRVFFDNGVKEIPEQYIKDRWRKNLISMKSYKIKYQWGVFNSEKSSKIEEALKQFEKYLEKVVLKDDVLQGVIDGLKELNFRTEDDNRHKRDIDATKEFLERVVGLKLGDAKEIDVPNEITNKGGSRQTRMKSAKEKAIETTMKGRQCKACFQYGVKHDSRNCPTKPSNKLKPIKKICK